MLSILVGGAVIYGQTHNTNQSEILEISSDLLMAYGPLHRTAWAFVMSWIIYTCSRGYGGIMV